MSQEMLDPEILGDFIVEAREHLETIEPNLLELEKAPDNLALLNEIFRPMHSMKGASGFLGLNKINTLAHRAENVMDELRKGAMTVTPGIMDTILEATDALRQMIDSIESSNSEGDVETQHIIDALDAVMLGEHAPAVHEAPAVAPGPATIAEEGVLTSQPQTEAPAKAENQPNKPADTPPLAQSAPGDGPKEERKSGDVDAWLAGLAPVETYTLTSFGEGHLRDFIEEAKENISSLSESLLDLEKEPENRSVIADLFRVFHNLKGNSGILAYAEVNLLTHEAETLLDMARNQTFTVTSRVIDLLLLVGDVLEALIVRIDVVTGKVDPFDAGELIACLQRAIAGEGVDLPETLLQGRVEPVAATATPDRDDITIFADTICQQMNTIDSAVSGMRMDGTNVDFADAMFRSLISIKNACGFMGLNEIKLYAERTSGIVDQGRKTGMDFEMLVDLLEQECAIIRDMIKDALDVIAHERERNIEAATLATSAPATAEPSPQSATPAASAPASSAPPEASKGAAPASRPAAKPDEAPKPADKPDEAPKPAAKPAEAPKPADNTAKASSTIRVDHEKLDHLMNLIGELIINRNRYTMLARQLESIDNLESVPQIAQSLSETTYAMARISDDLQATIMKVRMVPVASVFSRFPRLVRDLSKKSGKEVDLVMEGEDTELDKSVVEVIGDPLVHLIRNSCDHGIEDADTRIASGKSAKGTVYLRAYYKGNTVSIEIEDDGKGIDPENMRNVGIKKGLVTPEEARLLDDREAIELIFAPGFSSADKITDISGRGVGMDVVRTNIKSLKGSISTTSEVGKGTKFILTLPLTLAIIDALMVNVAGESFAIPLDAVSETTKIEAHRLTDMKGRKAVTLRGDVLGIVSLAEILGLPCKMAEQEIHSVVVIHDNDRRLGIVVDKLHERQEIVIKPLGSYLGDIRGISGATIMGDGSVILILDPHEMYMLATKAS